MFGWFRRKKPADRSGLSPQHWAKGLTRAQQDRLEQLALEQLRPKYPDATFDDGVARGDQQTFGLENLAQMCARVPADAWPEVVRGHFARMFQSEAETAEWSSKRGSFAWAVERLRLRLYPADVTGAELLVARQDLDGVLTALVADLPSAMLSVGTDVVEQWGRPRDEVLAMALARTLASEPVTIEQVDLATTPPSRLAVISGEGLCAATHVLRLEAWPELLGRYGTICAVPSRHHVLAAPIDDASILVVVQQMVAVACRAYVDGPGSITPSLYWRRPDGTFELQRVALEPGRAAQFFPASGFVAVLNQVAASS